MRICLFFVLSLSAIDQLTNAINANECEIGWVRFENSKCFKLFHSSLGLNQNEAQAHCEAQGSNLASILSKDEYQFIISYIMRENRLNPKALPDYWVGGRRCTSSVTWFDLNPFRYTDWYPGWGPQEKPENHCTVLATKYSRYISDGGKYGKLFMDVCTTKYSGILCNKLLSPNMLLSTLLQPILAKNA